MNSKLMQAFYLTLDRGAVLLPTNWPARFLGHVWQSVYSDFLGANRAI